MMDTRSIRFRMIALFCIVVGAFMAGTYLLVFSVFSREVSSQLDRRLAHTAEPIIADLKANPDEGDIFTLDLPTQYLELLTPSGKVLQTSRGLQGHPLSLGSETIDSSRVRFRTIDDPRKGRLRMAFIPFRMNSENVVLAFAEPSLETDLAISRFRQILFVLLLFSLLFTGAISAWYVGRSLRPVVELTRQAARLTQKVGDPSHRESESPVPVQNPHDELGKLASTFNTLFVSVNVAMRQLRQFVSDASHELRTPLAVLQGETEFLLSESRSPEDYQKTLRIIDSELKKLSRIVEALFTLAMADAGQLRVAKEQIYLDEVLQEACGIAAALAKPKDIKIMCVAEAESPYFGDEIFLRQLFLILLENAVKYSPSDTRIEVNLSNGSGHYLVEVKDNGIGIAPEQIPHIFERFYRATDVGEAKSGGLGLAIAEAITSSVGGAIECETAIGKGSTFRVTLPQNDK